MKKTLIALTFGLIALQVSATVDYKVAPSVDTQIITKTPTLGNPYEVIQITISGLSDYKNDDFDIIIGRDGKTVKISGQSHTRKDAFGKKLRDTSNKHYREVFEVVVDLPAPISPAIWGKHKSYHSSSKYFSKYKKRLHDKLVVTIPVYTPVAVTE